MKRKEPTRTGQSLITDNQPKHLKKYSRSTPSPKFKRRGLASIPDHEDSSTPRSDQIPTAKQLERESEADNKPTLQKKESKSGRPSENITQEIIPTTDVAKSKSQDSKYVFQDDSKSKPGSLISKQSSPAPPPKEDVKSITSEKKVEEDKYVGQFAIGSIQNLNQFANYGPDEPIKSTANAKMSDKITFKQKVRRFFRRFAADDLTGASLWSLQCSVASEFPEVDYDQENTRGHWNKRIEFLLSCVGYAVGLGNIWRFPFKCYEGGGGAFLIPYFVMLVIAALPIFFMELSFGQFASLGPITIWNVCPAFKGIGIAMVILCFYVCMYYNVIIAWSFMYTFKSFYPSMPWYGCNNTWNDENCIGSIEKHDPTSNRTYETSADQYWNRYVLRRISNEGVISKMQNGFGLPGWEMSLCLLLAWVLIAVALSYGVKSSGKVVYFTATFPYVVIAIMIGVGATLEGAKEGIMFYITPQWDKLGEIHTWRLAAEQIFYSMGIGFGSLITMSSYNSFHDNCHRDCIVVALINCFTSVIAGIAVFEVIGYMSYKTGVSVDKVGMSGAGLIFIAYPEGLANIPGANFWTALLFIMVVTLGVDSQIAMLETVITGIADEFPKIFSTSRRRLYLVMMTCLIMFFIDILLITPEGIYYFTLLDSMSASFSLMVVTISEIIAIFYIYGFKNFCEDIYMMLKYKVSLYWVACWIFIAPVAILFIFICSIVSNAPLSYGKGRYLYNFPTWAQILGWFVCITAFISIPIYMIYFFIYTKVNNPALSVGGAIKLMFRETDEWGPEMKSDWLQSKRYRDKLRRIQEERKNLYIDLNDDPKI